MCQQSVCPSTGRLQCAGFSLHEESKEGCVGLVLQEAAQGLGIMLGAGQQDVRRPHAQLRLPALQHLAHHLHPNAMLTMSLESTAKTLAICMMLYYRIS